MNIISLKNYKLNKVLDLCFIKKHNIFLVINLILYILQMVTKESLILLLEATKSVFLHPQKNSNQ